jgi:hypothetical protein
MGPGTGAPSWRILSALFKSVIGSTGTKRRFLKYLTPTACSQLRDHVRGTTIRLNMTLVQIGAGLDDSFVEMSQDAPRATGM